MNHLLWECRFSKEIWSWICHVFKVKIPNSFEEVWNNAKGKSPFIEECWGIIACAILRDLWLQKNKMIFLQVKPNIQSFKRRIKRTVLEGGVKIKGHKWSTKIDDQVILFFKLKPRNLKYQCIKPCYWILPRTGVVMFCCDGASFENPGASGFGVVIRDHLCRVLGVISGGIGIATNYIAEVYAIICAVELVVEWQIQEVILNSDSKTVVTEFAGNKMSWFVKMRWNKAIAKFTLSSSGTVSGKPTFLQIQLQKKELYWQQVKEKSTMKDQVFYQG
ncbi:uncharacterized protein LOC113279387 [Papaver somniferum]|uniref:uncharacterized protein LOC113279387 n=1 Tax=Papaver somniferum TaxID=3469 RepID=UPI000E6FCE19|nr:uncharacterized protein LOC113279387 [Papaver somniferum]